MIKTVFYTSVDISVNCLFNVNYLMYLINLETAKVVYFFLKNILVRKLYITESIEILILVLAQKSHCYQRHQVQKESDQLLLKQIKIMTIHHLIMLQHLLMEEIIKNSKLMICLLFLMNVLLTLQMKANEV